MKKGYVNSRPLAILMATYNSERYLRQQMESLLWQTDSDWTLYIRDDGSDDSTREIIAGYIASHDNIVLVSDSDGALGARDNFMKLLEVVDSDYYMFSDHDDMWLPDKVEVTMQGIRRMERQHPDRPVVAHTDLAIVDANLNLIHPSLWKYAKIMPELLKKRNYSMACSYMAGCTMGFNRQAMEELAADMPPEALMHDWWIAIQAIHKKAVILSIPQATILYRQHGRNESGIPKADRAWFLGRIVHLRDTLRDHRKMFPLLKRIGYGSVPKYYLYKILYTVRRNLKR